MEIEVVDGKILWDMKFSRNFSIINLANFTENDNTEMDNVERGFLTLNLYLNAASIIMAGNVLLVCHIG